MVKGALISFFLVVAWTLVQMVVFRLTATRQLFRTVTLLYLLTIPAYVACYVITPDTLGVLPQDLDQGSSPLGLLNGLLLYLIWYPTYISCFYYVERPLTLRLLIALLKAPKEVLTLSEMKAVYNLPYLIERRLEAMKDGGFVTKREGRYFLTPKGERMGLFFQWGRDLINRERFRGDTP